MAVAFPSFVCCSAVVVLLSAGVLPVEAGFAAAIVRKLVGVDWWIIDGRTDI